MTNTQSRAELAEPALELRDISKRFGNLPALADVSFKLRAGTVHTLLGENGAGKSTLMRIAFGMIKPDKGEIRIRNKRVTFKSPADAIALKVGMVHQHFMLVPAMTVAENVALGSKGLYRHRAVVDRLHALSEETGLSLDPYARAHSLSVAGQQRLEIIKALSREATILILDEPTAVLSPAESEDLLTIVRRLVDTGRSVVLITHKLRDAERYSDDVSVLRHGKLILTSPMSETTVESLAGEMLGNTRGAAEAVISNTRLEANGFEGQPVIRLDGVSIRGRTPAQSLHDVNLTVKAGEIVGIAALDGAASSLLRVVARRQKPIAGHVLAPSNVGFIPEDRQQEALVSDFTLFENVALKDSSEHKGLMLWPEVRNKTKDLIQTFDVRAQSIDARAKELSGGNQQKLVVARELGENPIALIAENPTWGLDIQATENVHERLRTAAAQGCAVVFYSSDIDEIAELAHRAFVIRDQTLLSVDRVTAESIGFALLGSAANSPGALRE